KPTGCVARPLPSSSMTSAWSWTCPTGSSFSNTAARSPTIRPTSSRRIRRSSTPTSAWDIRPMDVLRAVFVDPFAQMIAAPDLLAQTVWEGFVSGVLYSLIALGFVLIYKASGVFNFAQGIMMVFAALTLVGLHEKGVPAWAALALTVAVMYALALAIERLVLRPLVNQPDIILF